MQFNSSGSDALSYADLETGTGLNAESLKPVLALLVKQRVLELKDVDMYELNLGFKSKKIRVPLNMPVKAEQKQESAEVMKVRSGSLGGMILEGAADFVFLTASTSTRTASC